MNSEDRKIVAGPGVKPLLTFVLPGNNKGKVWKENPPDVLIMENLETSLDTMVDKTHSNKSGAIVERFIKPVP